MSERANHDALERAASGDAFPGPYSSDFGTVKDGTGRAIAVISPKFMGESRTINATAILFARSFSVVRAARDLLDAMIDRESDRIRSCSEDLEDALTGVPLCPLVKAKPIADHAQDDDEAPF